MNRIISLIPLCALLVGCQESDMIGPRMSVEDLRLPDNTVPGWMEDRARYLVFDTLGLYDIINGGAPRYIKNGLYKGITQSFDAMFNQTETLNCLVFIEDFSSVTNARRMFDTTVTVQEMTVPIAGYNSASAIARVFPGGSFVCAFFDRFYIEITTANYSSSEAAIMDAADFLQIYRDKIL